MTSNNESFIIMYHGAVTKGRGIETLIDVVSINMNIVLFVLGDGSENYIEELKRQAQQVADGRVAFHPAVPYQELWKYVGAADVGMVTIPAGCKSYYYMLPNKLLENIQCLTPIIGSDFPEIRKIVDKYRIGLLCDPTSIEEINRCIEVMRLDKEFYLQCKKNLLTAKQDLCWENEKKVLIDAMNTYL